MQDHNHPASAAHAQSGAVAEAWDTNSRRIVEILRRTLLRSGLRGSVAIVVAFCVSVSFAITATVGHFLAWPAVDMKVALILAIGVSFILSGLTAWVISSLVFDIDDARRRAELLAITDPVTGAFNRRIFFDVGEREFQQAKRSSQILSVLLLDIDDFKAINDRHGHAVGDDVLLAVSQACRNDLREGDLFARYGGEEFVVLMPATNLVEAHGMAERLRDSIEMLAADSWATDRGISPTISIGIAGSSSASSFDALLSQADRSMYTAKRAGKNRIYGEAKTD